MKTDTSNPPFRNSSEAHPARDLVHESVRGFRETLIERLIGCRFRLASMCRQKRPPRMSIPVEETDDDVYIVAALKDAEEVLNNLNEWRSLTDSAMRLRIGEATAQEIRTVRAVLAAVSIYSANVPSDLSLLAFGIPPAREADQQEVCRKSRRDRD